MNAQTDAEALRPPSAELPPAATRAIIRRHSKSFSLASLLLDAKTRANAHALYAYCRRADDAIDLAPALEQRGALQRLRAELDAIYAGASVADPTAAGFQRLVFELEIPSEYPCALLDGFELDVASKRYATLSELHYYCWCVAGTVGAMMCHVLGTSRRRALAHGAHLGMGMQLTNICRDIAEDWQNGRLYVPLELLPAAELSGDFPPPASTRRALAKAVRLLLREADAFYRSGDAGLRYLPFRSRVAVATARRVYSSIGHELQARDCDVTAARAVVPALQKFYCVLRASLDAASTPLSSSGPSNAFTRSLRFPEDVLPR